MDAPERKNSEAIWQTSTRLFLLSLTTYTPPTEQVKYATFLASRLSTFPSHPTSFAASLSRPANKTTLSWTFSQVLALQHTPSTGRIALTAAAGTASAYSFPT